MNRLARKGAVASAATMLAMGLLGAVVPGIGAAASKPSLYYVSLGDSYSVGYQPGFANQSETLHGYANRLVANLAGVQPLTLEQFGCGGATSSSVLNQVGCSPAAQALDEVNYSTSTQVAAAVAFITAHPGKVGLVTISIGGNDFDGCISSPTPVPCVSAALPTMVANIKTLTSDLRAAAGPKVPILAITYPDVALAAWLKRTPAGTALASESQAAFSLLINPDFVKAYAPSKATFVDVTKATGAYGSLKKLTTLKPYGRIPVPVAQVCKLTWMCAKGDIHPRDAGYQLIAKLLTAAYKKVA